MIYLTVINHVIKSRICQYAILSSKCKVQFTGSASYRSFAKMWTFSICSWSFFHLPRIGSKFNSIHWDPVSSPLWNAFTHASSDGQIWSRFHSNINVDSKWKLVSIQTHASSCWASWSLICFWYNAKSSFHRLLLCWSNISKLSLRLLSLSNWCDRIFTPVRISIEFTSLKLLVKVWVAFRGKRLFTETLLERNILTRRSKDLIPETSRGLLIIESGEK